MAQWQVLEGKHIVLRKARETDWKSMLEQVWGDEAVYQWMLFQPTLTPADAMDRCRRSILFQQDHLAWFVALKDTDEAIGLCAIREAEPGHFEECGICIGKRHQGKGYGKEIVSLLLELAFQKLGAVDVRYGYDQNNVRSKKLAMSFGFVYDRTEQFTRPWDGAPKTIDSCLLTRERYERAFSPERNTAMKPLKPYTDFILQKTETLLNIDSPTGYTENAAAWVKEEFERLGFASQMTNKGGVLVSLGGEDRENGLLLEAHLDTLGGMVAEIKSDGRLRLTNLGGMNPNNAETENVRVVTKFSGIYEGTFQLCNASIHVNGEYNKTERTWDTCEVVLDEDVKTREDTEKLGISVGDIVCFEPNVRITEKGYIKSRFLDDKLSVGILLGLASYLREEGITPKRALYAHITVFEEVGHGGSGSVPSGCTEAISVDMGCVGQGLQCTEKQVSICAKDSHGPYSYPVVKGLIEAAKKSSADYAVDVYPYYGSDVESTLRAGYDLRHGLIGAGVYASHGYERSHRDGAENTLRLLIAYAVEA